LTVRLEYLFAPLSISSLSSPSFFFFFFHCYGDHRDLHSFPTRRSSDLNLGWAAAWPSVTSTTTAASTPSSPPMTVLPTSFTTKLDRKSTRLNSSHVSISYAVFCLKKKKKKQQI